MDALATVAGLSFENDVLQYDGSWSIPLRELRLIGEYTTAGGPTYDDYFLVFVDRKGDRYSLPIERASDEVVEKLHRRLGAFGFRLAHSTDLASRIVWPAEYADKPLFDFSPRRPRTFGDRFRRLFGNYSVDCLFSPPARAALGFTSDPEPQQTILVADPDQRVYKLVIQAMAHRQWAIEQARTSAETIEKIGEKTYDVLLMSLQMNGIDVLRRLRDADRPAHVLLLSETDTLDTSVRRLADDVLTKPLKEDQLRKRLDRYADTDDKAR